MLNGPIILKILDLDSWRARLGSRAPAVLPLKIAKRQSSPDKQKPGAACRTGPIVQRRDVADQNEKSSVPVAYQPVPSSRSRIQPVESVSLPGPIMRPV